jgi:hypothetical protein
MRSVVGWNVGNAVFDSELLEWRCFRILLLLGDAVRLSLKR